MTAQSAFKISLIQEASTSTDEVCYQVALSSPDKPWFLAGQNYRLFYDASILTFQSGTSLLSKDYQDFNLAQNVAGVAADNETGCLHYANSLGFLNFSIDLSNTSKEGMIVPNGSDWLPTTQLCFQLKEGQDKAPTLTWGRPDLTASYAPSYVEVSEYISVNKTTATSGMIFEDIGNPCIQTVEVLELENEEATETEEEEAIETENDTASSTIKKYDISVAPTTKETADNICYEVAIQSASPEKWYLAGQNYRLYYDAAQLEFQEGQSLLSDNYESFQLVENIAAVDASSASGCLSFATNLGFLNYSIDMINSSIQGQSVPSEGDWLVTTELCFAKKPAFQTPSLIWARDSLTSGYATSFVEISEWVEPEKTTSTQANRFLDIGTACLTNSLLNIKAFIQGSFDPETGWMRDDLRTTNLIPLEDPYTFSKFIEGGFFFQPRKLDAAVLSVEGEQAVVDWVFLELRDRNDSTKVVAWRSALILRNGQIVDVDGKSLIQMEVPAQSYFIVLRHRNHLGTMTATPINITANKLTTPLIDFTKSTTVTYGQNSRKKINNQMCLWAGNADTNRFLVFEGSGIALPDSEKIFFNIFLNVKNTGYNYNFISEGYFDSDINMDGLVRYQGALNERDIILFNILDHPNNFSFYTNFFIEEQLPD